MRGMPLPIKDRDEERMREVGVDLSHKSPRSGTFIQIDHSVVHTSSIQEGLEVMDIDEALGRYDWLKEYWWKAVAIDADVFTAETARNPNHGYFIRAMRGAKIKDPVQACLYIGKEGLEQRVHNVIIAEEGSELNIITGCTISLLARSGMHVGVSEFFVKKGAKVSFTMIHSWADEVVVRPRTGVYVEEGGVFTSNYFCFRPVKDLQMYPTARCVGTEAIARFNAVLIAHPGSTMDVGSRAYLSAPESKAEMIARAVSKGGTIISRGHIIGEVPGVKGHLECRGLLLSENGVIKAIPELEGRAEGVDLSHEAAIGKIAEEEVEYLMSRGFPRDVAVSIIVRGFLEVDIKGLPDRLQAEIERMLDIMGKGL